MKLKTEAQYNVHKSQGSRLSGKLGDDTFVTVLTSE